MIGIVLCLLCFLCSAPVVSGQARRSGKDGGLLPSLIHNNTIYLSLHDAIALAIENNLDAEVRRYDLTIADMDFLRAKGGGTSRGVSYAIAQSPAGVGGPGSPLLNAVATNVSPIAPVINSSFFDVSQVTQPQLNLSIQGSVPLSVGPTIPSYDPNLLSQTAVAYRQANGDTPTTFTTHTTTAVGNTSITQGFSSGLALQAGVANIGTAGVAGTPPNLFSAPNLFMAMRQPLFRGFGTGVNRRYIRVTDNNLHSSKLLFQEQLIELVYGITRLYYDLVSLHEDVKVKQESLTAARKLYADDESQVEVGTMAPIELTRAKALVSSSELDLIRSQGLLEQQETVLKTQLSRDGVADPLLKANRIEPTESIIVPAADPFFDIDKLVEQALEARPDLAQADIQVRNGEILLEGSRSAARPEIDIIADAQTRGVLGLNPQAATAGALLGTIPVQTTSGAIASPPSKIYEAGIEVHFPIRNRVASSDATRDELQVRQMEARRKQLENQIREEVQNAVRGVEIARAAYGAAVQSRIYQEQLLSAERERLSVGTSANFFVVQDQAYLAQARSTEVAARSAYIKARFTVDRAVGNILETNHIDIDDAMKRK